MCFTPSRPFWDWKSNYFSVFLLQNAFHDDSITKAELGAYFITAHDKFLICLLEVYEKRVKATVELAEQLIRQREDDRRMEEERRCLEEERRDMEEEINGYRMRLSAFLASKDHVST